MSKKHVGEIKGSLSELDDEIGTYRFNGMIMFEF